MGTNGVLTAAQESAIAPNPKGRAKLLAECGFQAGAVVEWAEPDGTSVDIRLFRLANHNEAIVFFQGSEHSDSTHLTFAHDWDVPQSLILISDVVDKNGRSFTHSLAYRGDVAIEIWIYQAAPASTKRAIELLTAQWTLL
jgi:hypothetical protein